MKPLVKAILRTLIYADIFDYPLTLSQIHLYLISKKPYSKIQIQSALKKATLVKNYQAFYYLKTRRSIARLRQKRTSISHQKILRAQSAASILKLIPTIRFIAITGALSMKNAKKTDDIDLFIITQANTLWLTRLLAIFLLELFGLRRRAHSTNNQDKICLNLFLDESFLALNKSSQNLYTAHEVIQAMPIFDRADTHQKFLSQNSWVKRYLANTHIPELKLTPTKPPRFSFLETLAFKLQYLYMKPKITNEKVSSSQAFFHPRKTSQIVLRQYYKLQQFYL